MQAMTSRKLRSERAAAQEAETAAGRTTNLAGGAASAPRVDAMERQDVMNIGIYVTSLRPRAAAQARFQHALFAGLERLAGHRYHFMVFSQDQAARSEETDAFSYHQLRREGRFSPLARWFKPRLGRVLLGARGILGASGGRLNDAIRRWSHVEPAYYQQLRDLNVRLLWNMNQHELPTPLPFIRTIWDVNHRIHSMYPEFSYTRFGFDGCEAGMAQSLARASYVIVGTEEGGRQVTSLFGASPTKVRVIPFPTPLLPKVDLGAARDADHRPYIFYPARFWPHKNHYVILAALKLLREARGLDVRCVFTGADEGNLAYVLSSAARLGVDDLVEYHGQVSDERLVELYAGASALVYASAVGPDNLPPLEAMSLDCPVVTAEVPGAREQYGEAALYFPPADERALAEQIATLLQQPKIRQTLITRGRSRATLFTVDDYAAGVLEILDEFAQLARAWPRCDSEFT
jgi:glycosyltransferase involved in cell wall biosynthesis